MPLLCTGVLDRRRLVVRLLGLAFRLTRRLFMRRLLGT